MLLKFALDEDKNTRIAHDQYYKYGCPWNVGTRGQHNGTHYTDFVVAVVFRSV